MMEMIADDANERPQCLICNETINDGNFISLSDESVKETHQDLIDSIISQILDQHTNGTVLHCDTICKLCFSSFKQVHDMETRLQAQKMQLMNRFKQVQSTISMDDVHDASTSLSADEYMGPKKILDIPSSDDDEDGDSNQLLQHAIVEVVVNDNVDKKLTTLQEIEEQLVKIHGPPDDMTLENLSKHAADSKADLSLSDEEELPQTQFIKIEALVDDKSKVLRRTINIIKNGQEKSDLKLARELKDELTAENILTREDNVYTCMLCEGDQTVCGQAKPIMAHIKEAHDQRVYICDFCGDFFRKRTELSTHMDDHVANEEGDFQCEVCNRIFNNLRLFRIHKRMHQPQNKSWACDRCGKKYCSRNLLAEHMNTHTGFRPYQCSECGKDFASKYTHRAHERTHESRPRPHTCTRCPKTFLNSHNLMQHERTHAGIKDYSCHLCEKKFGSAHNLEVHSIVHTSYKPFICGMCGKAFARKAEIRDHERTHTGERPYQCEFCGAAFGQQSNLQSHKRSTHYDIKRHKCGHCNKAFKRRRLLEYHVKAVHTGERPFKCSVCDATFVYPEHFKKHRRIHTGEKPYVCEVCGKAFNSRDNRNAHRFVHSDKKPYECLDCGAGFMRKPLLYQHMQQENHVNDTIVVNQPRLPYDGETYLGLVDGQLEITQRKLSRLESDLEEMQEERDEEAEKLFIAEHMLGDDNEDEVKENEGQLILGQDEDDETIIIDGQRFLLKGEEDDDDEEEEETLLTGENFEGILTTEAIAGAQTQIIQTKEGPVQFLAVKIPNDNGEEEEAWIKILPENIAE